MPTAAPDPLACEVTSDEFKQKATAAGLYRMGARPKLGVYLQELWCRRYFIAVLASSKATVGNKKNYLGQGWQVLTPLLNAVVYILIFGFLMNTSRGTGNAVAFILIGTFTFQLFQGIVTKGADAIRGNISLFRSVRFPRAILPLATALADLISFISAFVVMIALSFLSTYMPGMSPIYPSWRWLLAPFAILLLAIFATGVAFILARWVAWVPDIKNFIGFVMRFIMYGSGVIFSIDVMLKGHPTLAWVLDNQPIGAFLRLIRSCIMNEPTIPFTWQSWAWGVGWAVGTFILGLIYFWRAEELYGRE